MTLPKLMQVGDSIWHLDSGRPGHEMMVLGGVHGNEKSGVIAVRELFDWFEAQPSDLIHGRLTIAIGNPEAVRLGTRGSQAHLDLNRSFLPTSLADLSVYEHRRAAELVPWLDRCSMMLDLHATNKPSEPFLAVTALSPEHELLAKCFDCPYIVLNEDNVIPGMAQGWVNARGGTALVFESGQADDLTCMHNVRLALDRALKMYGLIKGLTPFQSVHKQRFHMQSSLNLTDEGFRFATGRGLSSFEPMRAGDVIGYVGNTAVFAPYDGVLMFPKIPSLWKIGSPLVFFASHLP